MWAWWRRLKSFSPYFNWSWIWTLAVMSFSGACMLRIMTTRQPAGVGGSISIIQRQASPKPSHTRKRSTDSRSSSHALVLLSRASVWTFLTAICKESSLFTRRNAGKTSHSKSSSQTAMVAQPCATLSSRWAYSWRNVTAASAWRDKSNKTAQSSISRRAWTMSTTQRKRVLYVCQFSASRS